MSEAFDWQSDEVREPLLVELAHAIQPWINSHDLNARISDNSMKLHLAAALDFAGEKADGYQMARFLEDNRNWPANQELVAVLAATPATRAKVIKTLERAARGVPELPEMDDNGFFPKGTRFLIHGREYEIVGHDAASYSVRDIARDAVFHDVSRENTNRHIIKHLEGMVEYDIAV